MKKLALQSFLFTLGYGITFYLLQLFLFQRDMVATLPDASKLAVWDGGWYSFIAREGYMYKGGWGNVGFYPLFPLIWRWSHLDALQICFLNIGFLAGGIALLATVLKPTAADKLIWLSIPSFYFVFLPYSEALFILLASMLIYGIWKNNKLLIIMSLLLLGWVRPVVVILVPALLLMELIANERRKWFSSLGRASILYVLPLVISTALFVLYQYYCTGVWFAYFKHQSDLWGRKFSLPKLPFNSVLGPKMLWLNALALFVCLVCIFYVIRAGLAWLQKQRVTDKVLLLSFLFLAGMGLANILFNPHDGSGYTNVFGSHRYIFVSPFFLVVLHHFTKQRTYQWQHLLLVFLLSNAFWLCFGSYLHIMTLVYFNFCTAIIMMYMLYTNKKLTWPALAIAAINVLVQVQGYQFFINGVYSD